jgi:diadenylate cyclase
MHDVKHQLDTIPAILNRCNQALQTLERYKARLSEVAVSLTALEIEDPSRCATSSACCSAPRS